MRKATIRRRRWRLSATIASQLAASPYCPPQSVVIFVGSCWHGPTHATFSSVRDLGKHESDVTSF